MSNPTTTRKTAYTIKTGDVIVRDGKQYRVTSAKLSSAFGEMRVVTWCEYEERRFSFPEFAPVTVLSK